MKTKHFKRLLSLAAIGVLGMSGLPGTAHASSMTGGDATDQASADAVLDIVFTIDTSGSMYDDINAIGSRAQSVITNLNCTQGDVWVRARFMGITGNYGSVFNENVRSYVLSKGGTPTSNDLEDNGPAVVDLVNYYDWNNDTTGAQSYYKAIVTIGDEGTDNGQPVNTSDYAAAYAANQAAINSDTFLFAWVTNDPYSGVQPLFEAMAVGGPLGGYTFGNTGGAYIDDAAGTGDVEATLEDIICTAGSGGTNPVPEPATALLLGTGLAVLARRKLSQQQP